MVDVYEFMFSSNVGCFIFSFLNLFVFIELECYL